jgi:DegV family protein with EDD domain
MPRIAIVTDSTADLPASICAEAGITVLPHHLRIGEQQFLDGIDITTESFFALTHGGDLPAHTSQPGKAAFSAVFRSLAADHDGIVAITISSKLSSAFHAAREAAHDLAGSVAIEVVDSMNTTLGLGFQALHAAELARDGHTAAEIARRLHANLDAYHLLFFVDTLDHLQSGGRIGRATSLVGNLLQLKPVLRVDEGQVVPFDRARTKQRAIDALQEFVATWPTGLARLGVIYTTDRAAAEGLARELATYCRAEPVLLAALSPVLCSHVGPGAMGVCLAEPDLR